MTHHRGPPGSGQGGGIAGYALTWERNTLEFPHRAKSSWAWFVQVYLSTLYDATNVSYTQIVTAGRVSGWSGCTITWALSLSELYCIFKMGLHHRAQAVLSIAMSSLCSDCGEWSVQPSGLSEGCNAVFIKDGYAMLCSMGMWYGTDLFISEWLVHVADWLFIFLSASHSGSFVLAFILYTLATVDNLVN